jgi:hypothetical protein
VRSRLSGFLSFSVLILQRTRLLDPARKPATVPVVLMEQNYTEVIGDDKRQAEETSSPTPIIMTEEMFQSVARAVC